MITSAWFPYSSARCFCWRRCRAMQAACFVFFNCCVRRSSWSSYWYGDAWASCCLASGRIAWCRLSLWSLGGWRGAAWTLAGLLTDETSLSNIIDYSHPSIITGCQSQASNLPKHACDQLKQEREGGIWIVYNNSFLSLTEACGQISLRSSQRWSNSEGRASKLSR